jgi:hypothetical protein
MTRTARAAYPRAVIKDRSESRTGLDPSIRKSGAGHHNWGSLADELSLEKAADQDEDEEMGEETPVSASLVNSNTGSSTRCKHAFHSLFSALVYSFILAAASPQTQTENTNVLTEEELEKARNFRKNAFKGGCTSFFLSNHNHNSDFNPDIDLTAIARTSSAVLTASPVSPLAVRDGHDNKQILIHVSLDYSPKIRILTHYTYPLPVCLIHFTFCNQEFENSQIHQIKKVYNS